MSHTITDSPYVRGQVQPNFRSGQVTIIDYVVGGETVTAAEIFCTSVQSVFFAMCTINSLGLVLLPILVSGKIILVESNAGVLQQIPATVGLNAQVNFLATVTP